MAGKDFVMVQLSAAGEDLAQGGELRISNGKRTLVFVAGQPVRAELHYEWNLLLKVHSMGLFELAPESPAPHASPADDGDPTEVAE